MVDPDGALIMPGEFLPAAERSGLIGQIDQWVIVEACRMLGEQQRAGQQVHIEVNLSGPRLGDPAISSSSSTNSPSCRTGGLDHRDH